MKLPNFRITVLFLLSLSTFSWASVSLKNLPAQEEAVLSDRLQRILKLHELELARCQNSKVSSTAQTQNKTESPLILIEKIQSLRNFLVACTSIDKTSPLKSIRKPLPKIWTLDSRLTRLFSEIAPACFPVTPIQGIGEDKNACFGADQLIVKEGIKFGFKFPQDSLNFASALLTEAKKSPAVQPIDLFTVYRNHFSDLRPRAFLTLLASFVTSGNSGLTGYLQGIEDTLLMMDLNNIQMPALEVYSNFKMLQKAKLSYQVFRELATQNKIKLTVFGLPVNNWNRHNFMAAFLGCRENLKLDQVTYLVLNVGASYEAKDFISHLQEGYSVKVSIENFKVDTTRYLESAQLGWQICH